MKGRVDEANFNAKLAEQRSDRNEQNSRLWNVKLLFIPEKPGSAPETPEKSEKEALRVFRTDSDITRHSTWTLFTEWERKQNRCAARPIIVRFVSRKTRLEVLRKHRMLKGSNPRSSL